MCSALYIYNPSLYGADPRQRARTGSIAGIEHRAGAELRGAGGRVPGPRGPAGRADLHAAAVWDGRPAVWRRRLSTRAREATVRPELSPPRRRRTRVGHGAGPPLATDMLSPTRQGWRRFQPRPLMYPHPIPGGGGGVKGRSQPPLLDREQPPPASSAGIQRRFQRPSGARRGGARPLSQAYRSRRLRARPPSVVPCRMVSSAPRRRGRRGALSSCGGRGESLRFRSSPSLTPLHCEPRVELPLVPARGPDSRSQRLEFKTKRT